MTDNLVHHLCNKFDSITKKPEKILSASEKLINNIKEVIKETYDFTKNEETSPISGPLQELLIDNFDTEQIWQQIELQNESILKEYLSSVSRLVAIKDNLWFITIDESESGTDDSEQNKNTELNSENDFEEGQNENSEENPEKSESEDESSHSGDDLLENNLEHENEKRQKSIVDDEFFKLDEMEQFLKKQEQPNEKQSDDSDDEDSVDLFDNPPENLEDEDENSESENNPKYDDFFGVSNSAGKRNRKEKSLDESEDDEDDQIQNKKKKVTFDEVENDSVRENNIKSSLEIREERLKRKIEDVEGTALEDKPWQLKGEVTADKRPQNSLLEEIVDFDLTVRPAPVITEETTMRLEDVIKQRIKDKVWDDVERKTKLTDTPLEYKKKLLLDQEKSKQSLAQIYEEQYLKEQESLDPNLADKPEEEPKEHLEIKSLMKTLFNKLDALSNFHFTPKTVAPELRIVSNLPAINMEEVAPIAASDATLLAPEEIKNKPKGDEIGKSERTDTDKKRERRQKKQKQKAHSKAKKEKELEKTKLGLNNKYSKKKDAKLLQNITKDRNVDKMDESVGNKSIKSSTAFFTQLQDEVKGHIKSKT